ncbi:MAG: hypothetical protein Q8P41_31530 [Pseudomonadota bacterium]|nr:hypothetical protein [Pseudomonadota bacterium]
MQLNDATRGQAYSAVALLKYRAVKFDTSGTLVYAGAGDRAVGMTMEDYPTVGTLVTYYRMVGGWLHTVSGSVAVGDYAKIGADGVVVVEASNTTPTAFTIGQIRVARATGLPVEVEKV